MLRLKTFTVEKTIEKFLNSSVTIIASERRTLKKKDISLKVEIVFGTETQQPLSVEIGFKQLRGEDSFVMNREIKWDQIKEFSTMTDYLALPHMLRVAIYRIAW